MKLWIGFITAAVVFNCVSSEICTTNDDCSATTCAGSPSVICQHPDGDGIIPNNGLCTCADTAAGQCFARPDCYDDGAPNLVCPNERRHCYDNVCICDRFVPVK